VSTSEVAGPATARPQSTPFDRVVVIFNPHSTGDAPALAEELASDLAERLPDLPVRLEPTQYAGHARVLAGEAAATGRPLIVSVSGDGGYNEVVDGVMKAGNEQAVCAVKAAGNANDHRRATRERPLVDAIVAGDVGRIDLLRLTIGDGDDAEVRYAHSYAGLGLTPVVAIDLEKGGKGSFREIVSVVRTFAKFRPFTIEVEPGEVDPGGRRSIDSLLFANIAQMAKYATLSETGRPDDGRFEVIALPHTAKWRVLATAVRAAVRGLGQQPSARHYAFTTVKPMPLQVDGELVELEPDTFVSVNIAPAALATVT
jgi:diacylglycerol kinase family enzyme